jgi:hypothetical protein
MTYNDKPQQNNQLDNGSNVRLDAAPPTGASDQEVSETKVALRELGLDEDVTTE